MFSRSLHQTTQHRLLVCLLLLPGLLGTGTGVLPASAQQSDSAEVDTTARADITTTVAPLERKSPGRAVVYSVGGTALLLPVGGLGVVIGPAFGHFYAGNFQQAWTGIAIRTGGAGTAGIGGVLALGAPRVGWGLLTVGALIVAGSTLYDVATAWHSAKEYNESHNVSAQVAPTVGPRGEQVGLALRISF